MDVGGTICVTWEDLQTKGPISEIVNGKKIYELINYCKTMETDTKLKYNILFLERSP